MTLFIIAYHDIVLCCFFSGFFSSALPQLLLARGPPTNRRLLVRYKQHAIRLERFCVPRYHYFCSRDPPALNTPPLRALNLLRALNPQPAEGSPSPFFQVIEPPFNLPSGANWNQQIGPAHTGNDSK